MILFYKLICEFRIRNMFVFFFFVRSSGGVGFLRVGVSFINICMLDSVEIIWSSF